MNELKHVGSLRYDLEELRHVVANRDFDDYTRPYRSTLFATLHLFTDDREITHTNRLPAQMDVVDTLRAQFELIETLQSSDQYRGVPFCCICSNRGCTAVQWEVTKQDGGELVVAMEDLLERPIGNSPYRIPQHELYVAALDLCETVLEFCEAQDIDTFRWAERKSPPVADREHYASLSEFERWEQELRSLVP